MNVEEISNALCNQDKVRWYMREPNGAVLEHRGIICRIEPKKHNIPGVVHVIPEGQPEGTRWIVLWDEIAVSFDQPEKRKPSVTQGHCLRRGKRRMLQCRSPPTSERRTWP